MCLGSTPTSTRPKDLSGTHRKMITIVCKHSEEMKRLVSEKPLLLTFVLTYIAHFKGSYKSLSLSNLKKKRI